MPVLLWSVVSWLLNTVIIKFVVMAVMYWLVYELTPWLLSLLAAGFNLAGLTTTFLSIPPGVWFFLDFMALDVGIPVLLGAYVTRFLIRRIPIIG